MRCDITAVLSLILLGAACAAAYETNVTPTVVPLPSDKSPVFNVLDYGAKADRAVVSTAAFQKTIDAAASVASASVECIVSVPKGDYTIAGIALRSHVFLRLEEGSRVYGSGKYADYDQNVFLATGGHQLVGNYPYSVRFGVIGSGELDLQGTQNFYDYFNATDNRINPLPWKETGTRPKLIKFVHGTDVLLSGIKYGNSPDWTTHLLNLTNVQVTHVTVWGDSLFPNNDGIDPDSCINVTIENSSVDVADDGVCLKVTKGLGPLKNVLVRNMNIRSKSSAIKFGSATAEDIVDLLVENTNIWDSHNGIFFQHRQEGHIANCVFSHINIQTRLHAWRWWGNGSPMAITVLPRAEGLVGTVRNVLFENINAISENGVLIGSVGDGPGVIVPLRERIFDIDFHNVQLTLTKWSNDTFIAAKDYRPNGGWVPDYSQDKMDAFMFDNVASATFRNVRVNIDLEKVHDHYRGCTSNLDSKVDTTGLTCSMINAGLDLQAPSEEAKVASQRLRRALKTEVPII